MKATLTCQNPECGVTFEGEQNEDGMVMSELCDACQAAQDAASAPRLPAATITEIVGEWLATLEHLVPFQPKNEDGLADLVDLHVALVGVSGDRADNGLIGHLRDLVNELDAAIAGQMAGRHDVAGDYALERTGGNVRKRWQSEVLVKEVAERAIARARAGEDGEVRDLSPAEAVFAVVGGLKEAAPLTTQSLGWKVEGLHGLGLDPDLYCEKERGMPGVIVRKAVIEDPQTAGTEA